MTTPNEQGDLSRLGDRLALPVVAVISTGYSIFWTWSFRNMSWDDLVRMLETMVANGQFIPLG